MESVERRTVLLGLLGLTGAALTGCGGDTPSDATPSAGTEGVDAVASQTPYPDLSNLSQTVSGEVSDDAIRDARSDR